MGNMMYSLCQGSRPILFFDFQLDTLRVQPKSHGSIMLCVHMQGTRHSVHPRRRLEDSNALDLDPGCIS